MSKICPIMSKPMYDTPTQSNELFEVLCVQDDCQLWMSVFTTEGVMVEGCSYELAPQMFEGLLRV